VPTGTATLSFGATPTDNATVVVSGQATIASGSLVEAWIMGATTGTNNEQNHLQAGALIRCTPGIPVAATGFTIYGEVIAGRVTGDFSVQWVWN
jgi:hypothetical protein